VRGRIQATENIRSLLSPREAVFRRVLIECRTMRVVHEAAVDFRLASGTGEPALVDVEGARLVAPDPSHAKDWFVTSCETVLALPLPDRARDYFLRWRASHRRGRVVPPIRMAERLLVDGEDIEIVGYKSRSMDPTLAARLPRDAPLRATLRAGRKLPLLIAPAGTAP